MAGVRFLPQNQMSEDDKEEFDLYKRLMRLTLKNQKENPLKTLNLATDFANNNITCPTAPTDVQQQNQEQFKSDQYVTKKSGEMNKKAAAPVFYQQKSPTEFDFKHKVAYPGNKNLTADMPVTLSTGIGNRPK